MWMRAKLCAIVASISFSIVFASAAIAQDKGDLPDAPSQAGPTLKNKDAPYERVTSWHRLPKDFLHDQKSIWFVFPGQLAHGRHWIPTLAVTGITAGLLVADAHAMPYFANHQRNLDDINDVFNSYLTTGEVIAVPASLMIAGYVRHDDYQVDTAMLAGEAYADSAVVDLVIKAISRRERPSAVPPGAPFNDTFFAGGQSPFKGSSFPSGHAAGVFSVATVVATRYKHHAWVPILAYGFATAICFSRITTVSHFPSDVFLGAALGYSLTRYTVLIPR
jgi:membrane-associated phospholipid phosphatase